MIVLHHSPSRGTLVEGDTRPALEVIKAHCGMRWGRSVGFWYAPQSIGKMKPTRNLEYLAKVFKEKGFEVEIQVVEETKEEATAALKEHLEAKIERLEGRAEKAEAESAQRYQAAKGVMDFIPMGQPILVGHHSERRHRRDLDRIHNNMSKSFEAAEKAKHLENRAGNLERKLADLAPEVQEAKAEGKEAYTALTQLISKKLKKMVGAKAIRKSATGKGSRPWAIYWVSFETGFSWQLHIVYERITAGFAHQAGQTLPTQEMTPENALEFLAEYMKTTRK